MLRHEAKCDLRQVTCVHVDCGSRVMSAKRKMVRHVAILILMAGLKGKVSNKFLMAIQHNFVKQGNIKDLWRIMYFLLLILAFSYVMYLIGTASIHAKR